MSHEPSAAATNSEPVERDSGSARHAELPEQMQARLADRLRTGVARLKGIPSGEPAIPNAEPHAVGAPEGVGADERYEPFPLTDIQQAYWVGRQGRFELGNVSAHGYVEVDSTDIDVDRLCNALRRLIDRHEMLRAIVRADGRQQVLRDVPPYRIDVVDLRDWDPQQVSIRLAKTREEMSHQVRPADEWPVFEIKGYQLDEHRHRFHISMDALIADGRSVQVVIQEWYRLYRTPDAVLPPLHYTFREYVLAEALQRQGDEYKRAEAYWRERLSKLPPAPELPMLQPLGAVAEPHFVRRSADLEEHLWRALKSRAAQTGLTASGLLCAAYCDVLAHWSKEPSFSIVLTLFNRFPFNPQVNDIVGDFTSTILLSIDAADGTFETRARALQAQLWDNLDHRLFSGVRVLREFARLHGSSGSAVMPVVLTSSLVHTPNVAGAADAAALHFLGEPVYSISQTPQVTLDHQVSERDGALIFTWDAVDEVFPPGLLDDMFESFRRWLLRLATDDTAWKQLGLSHLLPPAQAARHAAANATDAAGSQDMLHTLFTKQVALRRDEPAVITASMTVTYGDLDGLSEQAGRWLRGHGVQPNQLVAIVMEKGWEQVVAVLGVLKSGAAYLPIDASLPPERLQFLLVEGDVTCVLTQSIVDEALAWPPHMQRLCVDLLAVGGDIRSEERPANADSETLDPVQGVDDLAYVIFTSGSTGAPKGVAISHRGAVNTIVDVNNRFSIGPHDRVLALSSLSFDLSVYDIFGLLAAGGAIVVPDVEAGRDPARWSELMLATGVTVWNSVPALMSMLVEYLQLRPHHTPRSLRLALLSGDWIPVSLPEELHALLPGIECISLGGATEASIWSILYPISQVAPGWASIPYGKPMKGQRFHVLNRVWEPCPDYVPGDLYISGVGLAERYWRDEVKTAASFIAHPLTSERLYRTGDLGRYLPDGNIEFLGREDFQVKVHGFRIELGEIEAALEQHPSIAASAVLAVGGRNDEKRLVAHVVFRQGLVTPDAELRAFIAKKLPSYMVPSSFNVVDSLPLTSNGKVDRHALPAPRLNRVPSSGSEPVLGLDAATAEVMKLAQMVLRLGPLDPRVDLLELGANSIDLVRLINIVDERLGFRPDVEALYRSPTLETLAEQYRQDSQRRTEAPDGWEVGEV